MGSIIRQEFAGLVGGVTACEVLRPKPVISLNRGRHCGAGRGFEKGQNGVYNNLN